MSSEFNISVLGRHFEFGSHSGFGWIPGEVRRITSPKEYKIPHMGWNEITFSDHKLFDNCEQGSDFYFVHSFYFQTYQMKTLP